MAGERISLGFDSPQPLFSDYTDAWFFPEQRRVLKPGPLRDVSIEDSLLQITHQPRRMLGDLSEIYGVLVLENGSGERAAYDFVNPAADANLISITPLAGLLITLTRVVEKENYSFICFYPDGRHHS